MLEMLEMLVKSARDACNPFEFVIILLRLCKDY